jgi:predicted transposase YdaD
MPNDFDKVIKENLDELMPHLLNKVMGLDLPKLEDLKDKIQVTLEREMDNLKKVVHEGQPWLDFGLHWEIQSTDEDMRARLLVYYALFFQKYGIPLKQIVVYIGNEPPRKILENKLELEGLRLEFAVVDLKKTPKEVFLYSDTPEEVVLAILCDFGADQPEQVIRQILQHLLKLIGRVPRLKKYQQQLQVLSRLRKLEIPTQEQITAMPIHYDIESDGLYLQGIEKGIEKGLEKGIEKGLEKGIEKGLEKGLEKGIEQGIEQQRRESVAQLLRNGSFTLEEVARLLGVSEQFVQSVADDLKQHPKR